jgi:hypothetical protein
MNVERLTKLVDDTVAMIHHRSQIVGSNRIGI